MFLGFLARLSLGIVDRGWATAAAKVSIRCTNWGHVLDFRISASLVVFFSLSMLHG
jgi:hypothetical protein